MTRQDIRFLCICSLGGFLEEERREEEKKKVYFLFVLVERNEYVKGKELSLPLYGEAFETYINISYVMYMYIYTCVYTCMRVYP